MTQVVGKNIEAKKSQFNFLYALFFNLDFNVHMLGCLHLSCKAVSAIRGSNKKCVLETTNF